MKKDYGYVVNIRYIKGEKEKISVKCYYKNESLAVVHEIKKWDGDNPIYGPRYRICILGDFEYTGACLDFLYLKSQKAAIQLADELNSPDWLNFLNLSQDKKNLLRDKLKKAAGM